MYLLLFFSETQMMIINVLKQIQQDFASEFNTAIANLPTDVTSNLHNLFQS